MLFFVVSGYCAYLFSWINSYSPYRDEKVIGDLSVYRKVEKNGKPTFQVHYQSRKDTSAFWSLFRLGFKNRDEAVQTELHGDRLYVTVDFIDFSDVFRFSVRRAYKANNLTATFYDQGNVNQFGEDTVIFAEDEDEFTPRIQKEAKKYSYLIKSAYKSTASVDPLPDQDRAYVVVVRDGKVEIVGRKDNW